MTANGNGTRIESLIATADWPRARAAIEKALAKQPDDHWLWSRLSGVMYEQRAYEEALAAAKKALDIVSNCPLALWSQANALDMLGEADKAGKVYLGLLRRGLEELRTPDADSEECWEGKDWTRALVADTIFRIAGCLAKMDERDRSIKWYELFLNNLASGAPQGIYSREDAVARLKKLAPRKKVMLSEMDRAIEELEEVIGVNVPH